VRDVGAVRLSWNRVLVETLSQPLEPLGVAGVADPALLLDDQPVKDSGRLVETDHERAVLVVGRRSAGQHASGQPGSDIGLSPPGPVAVAAN
jgi:hypothetical protein